jgi:PST family polysaccharide transporter
VKAVEELRRSAVRGAGVTVFSQGVVFAVQMVSTMILARLLAPADFGVVTMVTTFSLLLMNFGQNGFTEAVIQRTEMNRFLASNLFWINLGINLTLSVLFAGAGSLLARFYGDPRVTLVAAGISLTIVLNGLSVMHLALLKRAQMFSVTSANDIFASAAAIGATIALAWSGWGYWSLVVGAVARPFFLSLGAWYLCKWIPAFPRKTEGTGSVVRFALHVYGRFTVNYGARNTDNLLVGWRFGSSALGFYKKAYDLFVLPANQLLNPVEEVALSTLSRLEQGSPQYKQYFLKGLSVLAFVGMGLGAILTLEGRDIIHLLLGARWEAAGRIFSLFGPGIGIMLMYNSFGLIHLSLGTPHRWLRWVVVEFVVTTGFFLVGLHWGPEGVAAAWTLSFWLLTLPAFWYAGRPIRFRVAPVIVIIWKYTVAALLAAFASLAILKEMHFLMAASGAQGDMARITVVSSLFTILYLAAVILFHGGIGPLQQIIRLLPDIFHWGSSSRRRVA